jgi:hypothetical protein
MSGEQPSLSQSLLLQALEQISALDTKIGVVQGQNNRIPPAKAALPEMMWR